VAAYYRGGYLVQGVWPRGLLMATYYRGGYLVQGMWLEGCWWPHTVGEDI